MDIDLPTLLSTLGISSATAAWLTQTLVSQQLKKELQSQKYNFDKELTRFKSSYEGRIKKDVELFLKNNEAIVHYELEAKKRLYHAIGPLKFQLLLAARDYQVRIKNHTLRAYEININEYYGKSTIYRLARLLCLCELIESQVAYADFAVDNSAIKLLEFKKSLYLLLSGSKITNHHPKVNWKNQIEHLFFDVLSTIGNTLVVKDDELRTRCMNFSEFSEALDLGNISQQLEPLIHILERLDIKDKPILWLRLLCIGALCNSLLVELGTEVGFENKPFKLLTLISESKDEYIEQNVEEYVQLFEEIKKEGL